MFQTFLFCVLMSCAKPLAHSFINNIADMNDTTSGKKIYTWLALGDSYTIGESVNEDERFPAQTISLLKKDDKNFSQPKYIATTGLTTFDLLNAIEKENLQQQFDVVSLLIGVNDQYQHLDTAGYRKRFTECLQKAITLAGNKTNHVFVLSIPDYSVTPFAKGSDTTQIKKEIDAFNTINKEITLSHKISYTDITPFTREAKNNPSLIAMDGLHPSGKEYAKWAALLAPEIEKVIK
jgi:lysophospholipase L1-like esterase